MELLNSLTRKNVVVHLIGENGVGKSTTKSCLENIYKICLKILSSTHSSSQNTTNISFLIENSFSTTSLNLNNNNNNNNINIRSENNNNNNENNNKNTSHILLFLYDITNQESFEEAVKQLKSPQLSIPTSSRSSLTNKFRKILVGNKIDLEYWRKVSVKSGLKEATQINCEFCEISSFTGMHVDYVMDVILKEMFVGLETLGVSKILDKLRSEIAAFESERISADLRSQRDQLRDISSDVDINSRLSGIGLLPLGGTRSDASGKDKKRSKESKPVFEKESKTTWSLKKKKSQKAEDQISETSSPISSQISTQPQSSTFDSYSASPPINRTWSSPSQSQSSAIDLLDLPPPSPSMIPSPYAPPSIPDLVPYSSQPSQISIQPQSDAFEMYAAFPPPPPPPPLAHPAPAPSPFRSSTLQRRSSSPKMEESKGRVVIEEMKITPSKDISGKAEKEEMTIDRDEDDEEEAEEDEVRDRDSQIRIRQNQIISSEMEHKEKPKPTIQDIQRELDDTKSIMADNIDKSLERGEKLEMIVSQAEELQQQSAVFKKKATQLRRQMWYRNMVVSVCCCPCIFVGFLWETYKKLSKKAALFDNVLADTENAFQTLAKLLVYLKDWSQDTLHPFIYLLFGWLFNFINSTISFIIVLFSTIVLILPSFFTLLIVRTKTIEKESKAFGGNNFIYIFII